MFIASRVSCSPAPEERDILYRTPPERCHRITRLHYKHWAPPEPRHSTAMTNLGAVYADRKDFAKAIELYTRSLEIDPDSITTRTNLGGAYLQQGDLADAIQGFQTQEGLAVTGTIDDALRASLKEKFGQ